MIITGCVSVHRVAGRNRSIRAKSTCGLIVRVSGRLQLAIAPDASRRLLYSHNRAYLCCGLVPCPGSQVHCLLTRGERDIARGRIVGSFSLDRR